MFDEESPLTVGMIVGGSVPDELFSPFDLYACRLYTRALDSNEIKQNYDESVGFRRNMLKNIE